MSAVQILWRCRAQIGSSYVSYAPRCRMSLCRSSAGFSGSLFVCLLKRATTNAHFHAYCQDDIGIFSIDPIDLIAGSLPRRQRRLVEAWAELHQAELRSDWQR